MWDADLTSGSADARDNGSGKLLDEGNYGTLSKEIYLVWTLEEKP